MEAEVASAVAQFGVAGLVGWMWLSERRSAAAREQQLGEAHQRLMENRQQLSVLIAALDQNTRAMTAVELGQRRAVELLDRLHQPPPPTPAPPARRAADA
ncbi:MAG: hypothetical protein KF745_14825 [Phycisphaeraceae bacterium]|nr:hypothetical protein [Phycisphaeraceae bacterium]